MDQLRTALAWLKRYHFWVLTCLVVLIPVGCWWSATKQTSAKYDANQKKIAAGFSEIESVRNAAFHANDAINSRQSEEIKKLSDGVAKLWQRLYDKQRENVLKWPSALSKEFRDAVENMQFNDKIPKDLRNNYQNYITRHFPELPKQIGARPLEANQMGGPGMSDFSRYRSPEASMPGMTPDGMSDYNDYICEWQDQGKIRDELEFPQRPSKLRIWVTQEDLWVYHTLLDVIAKTNEAAGATRQSNAAVKIIYSLDVGPGAAQYSHVSGKLAVPPAAPAAGVGEPGGMGPGGIGPEGGPPMPGGPGGMGRGMGPGREMMSEGRFGPGAGGMNGPMSEAQEQAFLLSGRYLDDKGQPIMVGGGAVGAEAGPGPPMMDAAPAPGPAPPLDLNQFGTGYKRLPVRMVMEMDARWLPQLITNCANEPLRVEVQELSITPSDSTGMQAGRPGGGFEGAMSRGPGASLFPDHTGLQYFPAQPHVKMVIIQGTIYIFNKPNLNILAAPDSANQTAGM